MSQIAELLNASVSVHWLRHAHASHAIDNGAPITLVSATLGHADLKTTSGLCPRSARREFGALPKDQVIGFALHRSGARHSSEHLGGISGPIFAGVFCMPLCDLTAETVNVRPQKGRN